MERRDDGEILDRFRRAVDGVNTINLFFPRGGYGQLKLPAVIDHVGLAFFPSSWLFANNRHGC